MDITVSLRDGISLDKKGVKFSSLVIPWQNFMLQVKVIPMAQVDRLLQHLIESIASPLRQGITRKDIGQCGQAILHPQILKNMVFQLIPQLGFESLVLQQSDGNSLIAGHVKLPHCNIQISFDSRVDIVLQFLVFKIGEGLQSLKRFIEIYVPFIIRYSFRDFFIQILMIFEQIQLADDPCNRCHFFEPSIPSFPKIQLFIYSRFLVLSQDNSGIVHNNISQMLKKHSFFIQFLFFYYEVEDLTHLIWKLFMIIFTIDWHIDLAVCDSSQKLPLGIERRIQWAADEGTMDSAASDDS